MRINTKDRINKQRKGVSSKNRKLVDKQQVHQMIVANQQQVQKKWLYVAIYNAVTPTTTGTLVNSVMPSQGATNGEREGDSMSLDFIESRFYFANNEASIGATNVDLLRIVCVQARASTILTISYPAAPTTGIFDLGFSGAIDMSSMININASNETFHVLYDRSFPVNFGSDSASHVLELKIVPKIKKINFTPGTTTSLCGGVFWVLFTTTSNTIVGAIERKIYHDL
jgi:hypothetical protein